MTDTDWIEHDGKGLPVPEDTLVLVKYRNGVGGTDIARRAYSWTASDPECSNWDHTYPCGSDIVAYKVVER